MCFYLACQGTLVSKTAKHPEFEKVPSTSMLWTGVYATSSNTTLSKA